MDQGGKLPPVGDTVDLSIPSWSNSIGAAELGTVWQDPDFDRAEDSGAGLYIAHLVHAEKLTAWVYSSCP
jgi:hypothetical protein